MTNHPVHIVDVDGNLSPTALIPFCEFGGNMSVMGTKIDQFNVPVCNSFRPKILQEQLCYTVDPNMYKRYVDEKNVELSLGLFINYNEDRELSLENDKISLSDDENYIIIVETIGEKVYKEKVQYSTSMCFNVIFLSAKQNNARAVKSRVPQY